MTGFGVSFGAAAAALFAAGASAQYDDFTYDYDVDVELVLAVDKVEAVADCAVTTILQDCRMMMETVGDLLGKTCTDDLYRFTPRTPKAPSKNHRRGQGDSPCWRGAKNMRL